MEFVWNLFFMFGGVAAMMLGMKQMGAGLEKFAGSKMKNMLGKVTTNRFAGVGVGIAVTSIIQSSTATTVMLVGFVNIGLMTLSQATNVIMGANIGTTVTAHIVSLSGVGQIDIGAIAAMIGCVGILMAMLVKNEKVQNIGNILAGLGMIFVGLEFISTYAKKIMFDANGMPMPFVESVFQGDHNPLLLILIGIIITALVHSSSTITSLMVVLASIGVLTFDNALFLALGSNIGTCITSILSSAGTCTNAKRTAGVHLAFNVFGCLLFIAPLWIWSSQVVELFSSMSNDVGQQIAIFHTLFNVVTTLIMLPFSHSIVKLVCKIIPEKKCDRDEETLKLEYLDARLMETPAVAVANVKKEIIRMAYIAKENIALATDILLDTNCDEFEKGKKNEEVLNFLNKNITAYLTKLMGLDLANKDEKVIGTYYHVVSDIERVGDYAENIVEYATRLRKEEMDFSANAKKELKSVLETIDKLFDKAIECFETVNPEMFVEIDALEESIDNAAVVLEGKHIERLKNNRCTPQIGSIYLQTISNLERVGDHITNVAFSIRHYAKPQKATALNHTAK